MTTPPITFILTLPPTANQLWIQRGRKRIITPEYRTWRLVAGGQIKLQLSPLKTTNRIAAPIGVDIGVPIKMRGDIDNRIKPLLDLLVEHAIMDDDRHVHQILIARRVVENNTAVVTVRQLEAAP